MASYSTAREKCFLVEKRFLFLPGLQLALPPLYISLINVPYTYYSHETLACYREKRKKKMKNMPTV